MEAKVKKRPNDVHIKDIPPDVYRIAKAAAILADMSIGQWISKAIRQQWYIDNHYKQEVDK